MEKIAEFLLAGEIAKAKSDASLKYPFAKMEKIKRSYSKKTMLEVFIRDGFIDRYSGEKLFHPGFLRTLSFLLPDEFPFHPHGRFNECHYIFWDLLPSIDHRISLYRGGHDNIDNYITTSMKRNLAKNNWSIDELGWNLFPKGDFEKWDGQSSSFLKLVEKYEIKNPYIAEWYGITRDKIASQK